MTPRRWVLLCAAVLFLWQLGSRDLWAPDEPYFAEGAREMVVDGRWVVPHVNGVVLPSWVVDAVCVVPGGAHPSYAAGYSERDNAYYEAWDAIGRDREAFGEWLTSMRAEVLV